MATNGNSADIKNALPKGWTAWAHAAVGALAATLLGILALGAPAASAQEIVLLTPESPRVTNTLIGKPGGASHEYWVDYKAGSWAAVVLTPHTNWYALTTNRRLQSVEWFRAEIWGPNGRIDQSYIWRLTSPECAASLGSASGRLNRNCWFVGPRRADLVDVVDARILIKVVSQIDRAIPYTLEVRGLNVGEVVPGAPPGQEGPLISSDFPTVRSELPRYTGTLRGPDSPNTGAASVYYTIRHPGGGPGGSVGGNEISPELTLAPAPPTAQMRMVGMRLYRGTRLLQETNRTGPECRPIAGPDPNVSREGTALFCEIPYRSEQPELLTIEIFNGIPGFTLRYALART